MEILLLRNSVFWILTLTVAITCLKYVSSLKTFHHDKGVSVAFKDTGNFSLLQKNVQYEKVLKKPNTWLSYEKQLKVNTCVVQARFQFSLDISDKFLEEIYLNVSCINIQDWILQTSNVNSETGSLQMCGRRKASDDEYCIIAMVVMPHPRCVKDVGTYPVTNYFTRSRKVYDGITVCDDGVSSAVSVMGHIREYLSCRDSAGAYTVTLDILLARVGDTEEPCLPDPKQRESIAETSPPSRRNMVEICTRLMDSCPNNRSCLDKTCFRDVEKCNFQSECSSGEDEADCWCDKAMTSQDKNNMGSSTFLQNGFRCDFEIHPNSSHHCGCPWTSNGFKSYTPEQLRHESRQYPKIDQTLKSTHGRYVLAMKESPYPVLKSHCLRSTGPMCTLRFHAVLYFTTLYAEKPEALNIIIINSCRDTIKHERIIDERAVIRSGNGLNWAYYEVHIGKMDHPFQIGMLAKIELFPSFVAIDGLELNNCHPDANETKTCQPDEFQCESSICIKRDRLCNLKNDCSCGEDETHALCGNTPKEAKSSFENCNFQNGSCWWYSVDSGNGFNWNLQKQGNDHYVNINASNGQKGESAVLESVTFARPPIKSKEKCQVRFFMDKHGRDVYRLDIFVKEEGLDHRQIWTHRFDDFDGKPDNYEVVDILNVTRRFKLQFKAYAGMRPGGSISLDDITLNQYCFNSNGYEFDSCGGTGSKAPTQNRCNLSYRGEKKVEVLQGEYAGAQEWEVPNTATYSIAALGGSGGLGARSKVNAPYADLIHAKFNLSRGENLIFFIGQEGEHACKQQKEYNLGHICNPRSSADIGRNGSLLGGGGGGGGGTFVFKKYRSSGKVELLMVAGGGGGLGARSQISLDAEVKRTALRGDGHAGLSLEDGSGGGSGWQPRQGMTLAQSLAGGKPCQKSLDAGFAAAGGFGGGGGACSSGGGGGGYTGGDACVEDREDCNGKAGTSYIHPSAHDVRHEIGRDGNGFVDVLQMRNCPCNYYCIWEDQDATKYRCLCPPKQDLADDGVTCTVSVGNTSVVTPSTQAAAKGMNISFIIAIAAACAIFFVMIGTTCFCVCGRGSFSKDCHGGGIRFERIMSYCKLKKLRTQRVRQTIQRPTAVMEFNPNYDFIGAKHPQQLPEINRRHIQLVRPLGQGAFGEVYKGLMSHVPRVEGMLQVAVKTLPALSTDQTELDFQMEAIIVSKFNHPNIVKFLGVCFDGRPRFIVLELLEGGDLKSFLRDSRPKPSEPSNLTVMDLLRLAVDIAQGCQHLEEKHFIHRDIAARNCLLTTKGSDRKAKIADFGMARDIYRSDYYKKAGNALLPVKWMPPEAFLDGIFTTKTDVWSFGILLWEIFSLGYMPYPGCSNEEVMHYVTVGGRLDAPDSCPSSVYDIMASCWSGLAEERPPFSLICTSLEKCLQDEDVTSRGLPILYLPKLSFARGFKLPMPSKTMGSNGGDRSTGQSEGYLEPLLPTWITEGLADPRLTNEDDMSDEETQVKSKPTSDNTNIPRTKSNQNLDPGTCRIPSSEIPLLSVEDFQVLFDDDATHTHDARM